MIADSRGSLLEEIVGDLSIIGFGGGEVRDPRNVDSHVDWTRHCGGGDRVITAGVDGDDKGGWHVPLFLPRWLLR